MPTTVDGQQTNPCIIVAEDHPLIAAFLTGLLEDVYPKCSTYVCSTIDETVQLVREHAANLLILDINLQDGISLSWIDLLKKTKPKLYILVLSGLEEEGFAQRSLQMGADGFLNKKANVETITAAIQSIMQGHKYVSNNIIDKVLKEMQQGSLQPINPFSLLSNREFEIALLLMEGYGAVEIGNSLKLQRSTVSTHKMQILKKLQVENVIELNSLGVKHNIKMPL